MAFRRIVAVASTILAMAAACSTFDEATPGSGDDGGVDGPTSTDATLADGLSTDAGSDAWIPCSQRGAADGAHFCDDFDRQGAISAGWDTLLLGADASGDFFDEGTSGEPPRSFRARLPGNDPPGRVQLQLKKASPPSSYRLEFDVRIDSIPHTSGSSGFSHFTVIQFDDAPCYTGSNKQRAIELSFYRTGERVLALGKGVTTCPGGDAAAPPIDYDFPIKPSELVDKTFRHVSVTVAKGACPTTTSKMSLYVTLGDMKSDCMAIDVDAFAESSLVTTYLGAYIGSAAYADTAFVYDNVTVDLE